MTSSARGPTKGKNECRDHYPTSAAQKHIAEFAAELTHVSSDAW
jgi:hypothetical protein